MSRTAHLNVEPATVDGVLGIQWQEVYEGGFDETNPAHKFVHMLAELAERQCGVVKQPESGTVVPIEVDAHQILTPGAGPVFVPS